MPDAAPAPTERPNALLLVACFDALLAVLAILIALAPFGGAIDVGGKVIPLPLVIQVLLGLDGGLYAACVITVMVTLTRHDRWVRRTQIAVLALPIAVLVLSAVLEELLHHDLTGGQLLASLLVVLVDALIIFAMTGHRVVAWYHRPVPAPTWVRVTVGLFAAFSVAATVIGQVA
ncbi:MAG: hypothetical protein WCB85_04165 [Candidatus Dormiibacterota bacterium]